MSLLAQSSLGRYERGSHPQQRSLEDRYDPHGSDGYCPQRRSLEDRSEWGRKSDELPKGMCWQWGGKKRVLYVKIHAYIHV